MPRRAVVADELNTTLVGCGIADVGPAHRVVLTGRAADEEAAVDQDEAGAGSEGDAAQVDGLNHARALITADRHAADVLVLDPPSYASRVAEVGVEVGLVEGGGGRDRVADLAADLAVLVELVELGGGAAGLHLDHDLETHLHAGVDPGAAEEDEAARRVGVVDAVVGLGAVPVIPPQDHAIYLTGDGQRHLAVAFTSRGGLELGDPLFQVCAAIAAEIGCSDRAHAHDESESSGDGEATARFHQCPVHIHLQSYLP